MKKILLVLLSALFLTACGGTASILSPGEESKPRIPDRKPVLPSQASSQSDSAGTSEDKEALPEVDVQGLVDRINASLTAPSITMEDVERGWYFGKPMDRKTGTPNSWIWIDKGASSMWASPNSLEETEDVAVDALCRSTAGSYSFSCIERETRGCEHIPNSLCRCPEQTQWVEKQGCILMNEEGKSVAIGSEDFQRGWYLGLPSEKKLDTPVSWIWQEGGKDSRWQAPKPSKGG